MPSLSARSVSFDTATSHDKPRPSPDRGFSDPKRIELIKRIYQAIQGEPKYPNDFPSGPTWALLWLADIESLQKLANHIPDRTFAMQPILQTPNSMHFVEKWTEKDKTSYSKEPCGAPLLDTIPRQRGFRHETALSTTRKDQLGISEPGCIQGPDSTSTSSAKRVGQFLESSRRKQCRHSGASDQCRQRDACCVLTKSNPDVSDAVHIYPSSMSDPNTKGACSFLRVLTIFWKKERVDSWMAAIHGGSHETESIENLLCMDPSAHAMYRKGYFALEPVNKDNAKCPKWLVIRFWWLKQNCPAMDIPLDTMPQLPNGVDPREYDIGLYNALTGKPVISGDLIILETPDPINLPLPDIRILEMQWFMNRVTALSGLAEAPNLYDEDSDIGSDSDYSLGTEFGSACGCW